MHKSSMDRMTAFADKYCKEGDTVLDIGSQKVNKNMQTYRKVFSGRGCGYIGADIEDGDNVDIVIDNSYLVGIGNETFDIVVSGQTFEHCPDFWILFKNMVRVTVKDGYICVIAPSAGKVHRYPVDCWRFLEDSMQALADYAGVELIDAKITVSKEQWKDCVGVFRK